MDKNKAKRRIQRVESISVALRSKSCSCWVSKRVGDAATIVPLSGRDLLRRVVVNYFEGLRYRISLICHEKRLKGGEQHSSQVKKSLTCVEASLLLTYQYDIVVAYFLSMWLVNL